MTLASDELMFAAEAEPVFTFGVEGVAAKISPAVVSAGLGAVKPQARPGYSAAMNTLAKIPAVRPGTDLHSHPTVRQARGKVPKQQRVGFDAAVALVAGHLKHQWRPRAGTARPMPTTAVGQAAYLMGHGLPRRHWFGRRHRHDDRDFRDGDTSITTTTTTSTDSDDGDAPDPTAVTAAVADAGPAAVSGMAQALVESHHESPALRVAEVAGGGALAGGGTYYILGLKTALAVGARAAASGGVGLVVGGLIWALRHKSWDV